MQDERLSERHLLAGALAEFLKSNEDLTLVRNLTHEHIVNVLEDDGVVTIHVGDEEDDEYVVAHVDLYEVVGRFGYHATFDNAADLDARAALCAKAAGVIRGLEAILNSFDKTEIRA